MITSGQHILKQTCAHNPLRKRIFQGLLLQRNSIRNFSILGKPSAVNHEASLDCAEAFPMHSIIPEDLIRDLVQKKRMLKLSEQDIKPNVTLDGVFPEIIFEENGNTQNA
ncbi:unnamed protein product [Moneuplotes crassus]|uniref:Uncharacterized protein n=1 Tax=Euplotes crassus TaxID=5936 RepID=A0AAD2D626_EUPCR|nr:unnamed protein product [Moneuplotes crassus]